MTMTISVAIYKSSHAGGLLTRPLRVTVAPGAWPVDGPGDLSQRQESPFIDEMCAIRTK